MARAKARWVWASVRGFSKMGEKAYFPFLKEREFSKVVGSMDR